MNQLIAGALVIIVVLVTIGITYTVVTIYKDHEIKRMKAEYDNQIENLTGQLGQYQIEENVHGKFVGSWNPLFLASTYNNTLRFFSNGTYASRTSMNGSVIGGGTWEVHNGILFLTAKPGFTDLPLLTNRSFYYSFYDNDTTLVLTTTNISSGSWDIRSGVYIKKPPKIQFAKNDFDGLQVASVDQTDLEWRNINITISAGNYSEIYWYHSPISSIRFSYGNGSFCPDWGNIAVDNMLSFPDAIVTLTWKPTNTIIGVWDFT